MNQRPPPQKYPDAVDSQAYPMDGEIASEHRLRFLRSILWVSIPVFMLFSLSNFLDGFPLRGWVSFIFTCLVAAIILYSRRFKTPRHLGHALRVFMLLLAGLFLFYTAVSGEHYGLTLWSYTFPLVVFFVMGKKEGSIWCASFWLLQCLLLFGPDLGLLRTEYTAAYKLRFGVSLLMVAIMAYLFENSRHRAQMVMQMKQWELEASEKRTRQAYDELKVTQGQLVQSGKLASIGELAAGVAHELNQPLMVIRGSAQLVDRQVAAAACTEEDLTTLLNTIQRNTKRMIVIIDHLRSFSRQSDATFQSVDVDQVIDEAFLMIGEQLRLRGIKVARNREKSPAIIHGDSHQLEQVFLNLLANARDAIASRDSVVNQRQDQKSITITTRKADSGDTVEVLIQDNGCGIADENLDTIFDPFFTTKEVGRGTGLGLSLSYSIIRKHDGQIKVADTSSDGTTFLVVLPSAAAKGPTSAKIPGQDERIPASS